MPRKPNDLITIDTATALSDKSKASIRYYLSKGKIKKYRKDPDKKNSPVLVSRKELMAYLSQSALPKSKSSTGRPKRKVISRDIIKQERDEALKEIILLKSQIQMKDEMIEMLKQHTNDVKESKQELDKQVKDLRVDLSSERERSEKLDNRITNITHYLAQPWWRRVGKPLPLLTG